MKTKRKPKLNKEVLDKVRHPSFLSIALSHAPFIHIPIERTLIYLKALAPKPSLDPKDSKAWSPPCKK